MFITIVFLTACGGKIETNMSRDMLPFEFTTQDNEKLSNVDLEGKYWIADMVFTNCTSVCLPMTSNMAKLQEKMKKEGMEVPLISFSVDPEFDSPEVLKEYAKQYGADLNSWSFLTGYDNDTIKELSIKSFQSILVPAPEGTDQVTHGTKFYLIDPEGKVIKNYDGLDSAVMDDIISDLKKLDL